MLDLAYFQLVTAAFALLMDITFFIVAKTRQVLTCPENSGKPVGSDYQ